jgi:hypothetical protein
MTWANNVPRAQGFFEWPVDAMAKIRYFDCGLWHSYFGPFLLVTLCGCFLVMMVLISDDRCLHDMGLEKASNFFISFGTPLYSRCFQSFRVALALLGM